VVAENPIAHKLCCLPSLQPKNGTGVDRKDEKRAIELFKQACGLGNKDACTKERRLAAHTQ
jgi:TPR repeat protein